MKSFFWLFLFFSLFSAPLRAELAASDYAVEVGNGGFTVAEFESYLTQIANQAGWTVAAITESSRYLIREHATQMEQIFQAARDEGMLSDEVTKQRLIGFYLKEKVGEDYQAKLFKDEELRTFYEDHPELFATDARVKYQYILLRDQDPPIKDIDLFYDRLLEAPEASNRWKGGSVWEKPHQNCLLGGPALSVVCESIFRQEVDSVVLHDGGAFGEAIVWMKERQGSLPREFEDISRVELISLLLESKQKDTYETFMRGLRNRYPKGTTDAVVLFQSAIREHFHRLVPIRQYLIFRYVSKRQSNFAAVVQSLKERYPPTIHELDLKTLKERRDKWSLSAYYWNDTAFEFDANLGKFRESHILEMKGEGEWWQGVWAPSTIEFQEPKRVVEQKVMEPPKLAPKTELREAPQEERLSPLREEVDEVAEMAAEYEQLMEKLDKQPISMGIIYIAVAFAVVIFSFLMWKIRQ